MLVSSYCDYTSYVKIYFGIKLWFFLYISWCSPRENISFLSANTDICILSAGLLSSVQSLSHVRLFATPWIAARQASLSISRAPSTCHIRPSINVCLKSQVSHFQLLLLFCLSVTSNSLQPLGPALCQASLSFTISQSLLNLCPLSQSCPLSSQSPASGSFLRSQLFISSGQSIGASTSTSVLPINTQDLSPLGWTGWISLGDFQESSPTPQFKSINSLALSFLHSPTLTSIHDHWKNHSLD